MKRWTVNASFYQWLRWGVGLSLMGLLAACGFTQSPSGPASLNSRYNDEQPALSGDGRWVAFVSNRYGNRQIVLYDLQARRLETLRGLNQDRAIAETPSLSLTGRYLVYVSSSPGTPEIALYDRATKRSEFLLPGYRSWVRNPQISPDGRYVVFETARRGQWDIEVLDRGPNIELDILDGIPVNNP